MKQRYYYNPNIRKNRSGEYVMKIKREIGRCTETYLILYDASYKKVMEETQELVKFLNENPMKLSFQEYTKYIVKSFVKDIKSVIQKWVKS